MADRAPEMSNNTPSKAEALAAVERIARSLAPYGATARDGFDTLRDFIKGSPDAANAGEPARLPVAILDEEMAALRRFYETSEDGEDYDVPKGMMQRLALIGLVRRTSGSRYELTDFGSSVINGDFATPTGVAADESTRAPDGRVQALQDAWDAIDKLYASTEPEDPKRRGLSIAAKAVADLKRAAPPSGERPSAPAPEGSQQ